MIRSALRFLARMLARAMMFVGIALILLSSMVSADAKPDVFIHNNAIYFSPGGEIHEFAAVVQARRVLEMPVRIAGTCMSACTEFLGLPGTCVGQHASLWFHAPLPDTEEARLFMMRMYPKNVQDFIARHGGLRRDWIVLDGPEMMRLLPVCAPDPQDGL